MSAYRETGVASVVVAAFSGRVHGLDPATGRRLWEYPMEGATPIALALTPTLIFAASAHSLACLHYPSGGFVWVAGTRTWGRATLLLDGERLFVAKRGEVECFSFSGQSLWHEGFQGKGAGEVALGVPGNVAQADEKD